MFKLYGSDEEQWQAIKDWWQRYGMKTILLTLITLALIISITTYQQQQEKHYQNEATLFANWQANHSLPKLLKHTAYADLIHWQQAKKAIHQQDYRTASQQLIHLSQYAKHPALKKLARYQLTQVYLQTKQYNQALTTSRSLIHTPFKSLAYEAMGDAHRGLKHTKQAKENYLHALHSLKNTAPEWQSLNLRINYKVNTLS